MTDFFALEERTGVRFNWNVLPVARTEALEATLPVAALYTPLKSVETSTNTPIECKGCHSIINQFCSLDTPASVWTCALCGVRNPYRHAPPDLLPLGPVQHYVLSKVHSPLMLVFVVDLCMDPAGLLDLKTQLTATVDTLATTDFFASVILFDGDVRVCEPVSPLLDKTIVLPGSKSFSDNSISKTLNVEGFDKRPYTPHAVTEYFTNNTQRLHQIITSIQPTTQETGKKRPLRSTGLAIQTAKVLLQNTFQSHRGHVLLFTDGPCTSGPGSVVDLDKSKPIRSFSDIRRNKAKFVGSKKFYDDIARQCVERGHISISLFISGYDQVGLFEMRSLSERTGGVSLLVDSYSMNIFKSSFKRLFELQDDRFVHLNCGDVVVNTSSHLEVAGFIGPGTVQKSKGANVSDYPIGHGLGNTLRLGMLNQYHTLGVYFRVKSVAYSSERKTMPKEMFVQFKTSYRTSDGITHLKVVTLKKQTTNISKMDISFDQEAAVVLSARKVIHDITHDKMEHSETETHFKDETVKLLKKYAIYVPNEPSSFSLHANFELFPQFIYNLLRSPMMTNFNTTPDESTYYTSLFNRADLADSLLMIQPHLTSYKDNNSTAVLLDTSSLDPDAILLMDSFFHIVIQTGSNMDPKQEQIQPAIDEAMELCGTRFPLPRYIITNQGSSQSRFLKSRLNPSNGIDVHTEQATLAQFYRQLVKNVTKR